MSGSKRMAALLIALTAASTEMASAQQRGFDRPTRVPVAIVVDPAADYQAAPFLIVRRVRAEPRDVILVPRADVANEVLNEAIFTMIGTRAMSGDTAQADAVLRYRVRPSRQLQWIPAVTARLKHARAVEIPGMGIHPILQIWLPPQRRS